MGRATWHQFGAAGANVVAGRVCQPSTNAGLATTSCIAGVADGAVNKLVFGARTFTTVGE
ncbi:hypothetical protein D3C73_1436490 [compost metagenome]